MGKQRTNWVPWSNFFFSLQYHQIYCAASGKPPWSCRCKLTHFSQQSSVTTVRFPMLSTSTWSWSHISGLGTVGKGRKTRKNDKKRRKTKCFSSQPTALWEAHCFRSITSCTVMWSTARYTPARPWAKASLEVSSPQTVIYFILKNTESLTFVIPTPLLSTCINFIPQL